MKSFSLSLFLVTTFIGLVQARAHVKIQIDSIPDNTPHLAVHAPLMINVDTYTFQISDDQTQARVYVDYSITPNYDDLAPLDPTLAQLPGLTYNAAQQQIVYVETGNPVVCATVTMSHGIFGDHLKIKKTGLCRITSTHTDHRHDSGFQKRNYRSLDVFFETP